MEIWINPACSKCRSAKADLDAAGVRYTERRYLDDPPSEAELSDLLTRLGLEPWDIARPVESKQAGITLAKHPDQRTAWIRALADNPRAIQRPIITADDGSAVIARDPETVRAAIERFG